MDSMKIEGKEITQVRVNRIILPTLGLTCIPLCTQVLL